MAYPPNSTVRQAGSKTDNPKMMEWHWSGYSVLASTVFPDRCRSSQGLWLTASSIWLHS